MGTGQLLFSIAPFFKHSNGIDISENMLSAAKAKLDQELP
jgi:ubiquinone/menaquinone biosynthesis C-methylase UbiE